MFVQPVHKYTHYLQELYGCGGLGPCNLGLLCNLVKLVSGCLVLLGLLDLSCVWCVSMYIYVCLCGLAWQPLIDMCVCVCVCTYDLIRVSVFGCICLCVWSVRELMCECVWMHVFVNMCV
jgi:hypothetical protein